MEKRHKVKHYFSPGLKYFLTLLPSSGIIVYINARTTSKIKEKVLDTSVVEFAIFMFCMIGCGMQCWHLGKTTGVEATVQYMIDQGVLEVEEDS